MDIIHATEELLDNIRGYYGQERMLVLILFCALLAYLYFPELKRIILYPTLLVVVLLINPVLYELVFSRIIYWRLLWMIPGTYLVAYVICQIYKVGKNVYKRAFILISLCLCVAFSGDYAYNNASFHKTQNLEKIDPGVKEVGEFILANCERARCITHAKYLSQIRQYSTDIELLYGRNVYGYITGSSAEFKKVYRELEKETPDYSYVLEVFKKNRFYILVVRGRAPIPEDLLVQYDLMEIGRLDGSIVYKKDGKY